MTRPVLAAVLAVAVVGVAAAGCGPVEPVGIPPTLAGVQEGVFDVSCSLASCHSKEAHNAELVLTPDEALANLIDVDPQNPAALAAGMKRVVAGDPENSLLFVKMKPGMVAEYGADFGDPMPFGGGDGADPTQLEAVRQWIADGAQP